MQNLQNHDNCTCPTCSAISCLKWTHDVNILLIEDAATCAKLFLSQVSAFVPEEKIRHASNMAEAWSYLSWADVIVLDLQLPDSTLDDTIKMIGQWSPVWPIVVYSSYDREGVIQRCIAAGANSFVAKDGVTVIQLHNALHAAIELSSRSLLQTKILAIEAASRELVLETTRGAKAANG